MLLTEEEAKTKWCPMVRFITSHNFQGSVRTLINNRDGGNESVCIASECMWWKWDGERGYCGKIGRC